MAVSLPRIATGENEVTAAGYCVRGTLLAVPIVNSFGFLNHTRYMPDRRDLNRCFPGSDRGSLASLVAVLCFAALVMRLHSSESERDSLSQTVATLQKLGAETFEVADLESMTELGLRGVMLPGIPPQADYDDPMYDELWDAIIDLGDRISDVDAATAAEPIASPRRSAGHRMAACSSFRAIRSCIS